MLDKFVQELAAHILYDFHEECEKYSLNEYNIETFVKNGVEKAMNVYGIEYQDDLTFFVECKVLLAPDFDYNVNYSWAQDILFDDNLNGSEKMAEIEQYMLFNLEEPI